MIRLAITGGIACGKSEVGQIIADMRHDVIEADIIAHDQMRPGTGVFRDIRRFFGKAVINDLGEIDRKVLGRLVIGDAELRAKLNSILHPVVIGRWNQWLKEREDRSGVAAVVVPLLYEAGAGKGWDAVVCVSANRDVQLARLVQRGMSAEDAVKWIAAQMKLSEKMRLADYVVCNNGSMNVLRQQINIIMEKVVEI